MKQLLERLSNPVLAREYQWRMRNKRTPWMISLYLLVMGGIILASLFLMSYSEPVKPEMSRGLFIGLTMLQLLVISAIVPGITAGLISNERERQTLSILLTTSLSSSKIVLSKWFASLSFTLLLLIASAPLYMIVYLFGGVSPEDVWKVFIHFIVTTLFLGSLGIFYSSWMKSTGRATVVSYITVVFIGIGLIILLYLVAALYAVVFKVASPTEVVLVQAIGGLHPWASLAYGLLGSSALGTMHIKFDLYNFYLITYTILSAILLLVSIYLLSPVRFKTWGWVAKLRRKK